MRRPLSVIGFSALSAMLCLINLESTVVSFCLLVLSITVILACIIINSKKALPYVMVFIGIGLSCFLFSHAELERKTTLSLCSNSTEVEAVVTQTPEFSHKNERFYAVAKLKSLNGKKAYGKIRLSFSETKDEISSDIMRIGDEIAFTANVYKIGSKNDDVHKYYNSVGIFTGCYNIRNLTVSEAEIRPVSFYVEKIRNYIFKTVNHNFDSKTSGIIIAILTGEKSFCDDEIYSDFKKSGVAHIMAVSGMHLSVWVLFMCFLLDRTKRFRWLTNIVLCFTVLFIMFLALFSPSVMRAGVMVLLHIAGRFIGRKSDGLNSLGFACVVLLLANPYIAISIGFQLSFMSVASIYIFAIPFIEHTETDIIRRIPTAILKKTVSTVLSSLCVSFSVILFTFPITVMAYGGISLVSPLTNLLLLPVTTPFMVISAAFCLFSGLPVAATVLKLILKFMGAYITGSVEFAAGLPNAYVPIKSKYLLLWAFLLVLTMVSLFMLVRKRLLLSKLSFAAVMLGFFFAVINYSAEYESQYRITPLPTENNCAYVVSMKDKGVLVGVNDDYYFAQGVADTLERFNLTLEAVFLTQKEYLYEAEMICTEQKADYILCHEGERVKLFGEVEIELTEHGARVYGNAITTQIFNEGYLQNNNNYDIMLNNYGVLFSEKENAPCEYIAYSQNTANHSIVVNKNGEYSFGG